jgi:hypothetical protein
MWLFAKAVEPNAGIGPMERRTAPELSEKSISDGDDFASPSTKPQKGEFKAGKIGSVSEAENHDKTLGKGLASRDAVSTDAWSFGRADN